LHRRSEAVADHELFRAEALQNRDDPLSGEGDVLRLTPSWTRWFYWLLVAVFAGSLLFLFLGSVGEYAEGPALLEVDGRLELTAMQPGIVSDLAVRPHETVAAGQLLVRFHDADEAADLVSARQEYELLLVEWLRRPTDPSVRATLATLDARIEHAESRLRERSLRAPRSGVVSGIRVRPGQSVSPGEIVLTLVGEGAGASIVAMLPGHYRPLLRPGSTLDLELSGYPHVDHRLTIESIDDDVIGPAAVRRYLGGGIADTVALPGAVVLVRARLPATTFDVAGVTYSLHDGMQGWAQARVREERILFTLIPGLKNVGGNRGE